MSTLTISKNREETKLTVCVVGRVDTTTAPQLDDEISQSLEGIKELVLDLSQTDYVSSAGLRVLLSLYKTMNAKRGSFLICSVKPEVYEVFDVTGLTDFFEIQ